MIIIISKILLISLILTGVFSIIYNGIIEKENKGFVIENKSLLKILEYLIFAATVTFIVTLIAGIVMF